MIQTCKHISFCLKTQTGHVILDRSVSRSKMNLLVSVQKLVDNHVFLFLTLTRSMIFGSLEINLDTRNKSNEDNIFPTP